jgi:hypothetical protein
VLLGDGAEPGDLSLIAEMLSLSGGERFPPLDLQDVPQSGLQSIVPTLG